MQKCSNILKNRVKYVGNYTDHECKIELSDVSEADKGGWICEMESYVFGSARGNIEKGIIEFNFVK